MNAEKLPPNVAIEIWRQIFVCWASSPESSLVEHHVRHYRDKFRRLDVIQFRDEFRQTFFFVTCRRRQSSRILCRRVVGQILVLVDYRNEHVKESQSLRVDFFLLNVLIVFHLLSHYASSNSSDECELSKSVGDRVSNLSKAPTTRFCLILR